MHNSPGASEHKVETVYRVYREEDAERFAEKIRKRMGKRKEVPNKSKKKSKKRRDVVEDEEEGKKLA